MKGTWREGCLAGDPQGYVEKALETGISFHRAPFGEPGGGLVYRGLRESRVVTGFLTGHNTLKTHLYLLGLHDSPLCRKCGVGEETSAHILCECEVLASLRHAYLGSFSSEPKDIRSLGLGAIWNYSRDVRLP